MASRSLSPPNRADSDRPYGRAARAPGRSRRSRPCRRHARAAGTSICCESCACFAREVSARARPQNTCWDHRAARDDGVVNDRPKEDVMESTPLVDCAGRRRSSATLPGYHRGRPPRNKGLRDPPDPPTVEEIIAVMRAAGDDPDGVRLRGLIVVLWRAGLRVSEALALAESDLDRVRGAIQVRHGKGGRRREVGIDRWAWEQLDPWLNVRAGLPIGALFCVLRGPTRGRPCSAAGVRVQLRNAAIAARGASAVCAASAPACSRCRDVARGRAARGHTAAARACRPRGHVRVLAWHR